jgi:GTPase SAR1 family protein
MKKIYIYILEICNYFSYNIYKNRNNDLTEKFLNNMEDDKSTIQYRLDDLEIKNTMSVEEYIDREKLKYNKNNYYEMNEYIKDFIKKEEHV